MKLKSYRNPVIDHNTKLLGCSSDFKHSNLESERLPSDEGLSLCLALGMGLACELQSFSAVSATKYACIASSVEVAVFE